MRKALPTGSDHGRAVFYAKIVGADVAQRPGGASSARADVQDCLTLSMRQDCGQSRVLGCAQIIAMVGASPKRACSFRRG